jgi:hypothetical protein
MFCFLGFLMSGYGAIPRLTALGLVAGSLAASATIKATDRWAPLWFPPLVTLAMALTLGQLTTLGGGFSLPRLAAMVLTTLATMAPAQVLAIAAAVVVGGLRSRL